jgi:hypothetical protein
MYNRRHTSHFPQTHSLFKKNIIEWWLSLDGEVNYRYTELCHMCIDTIFSLSMTNIELFSEMLTLKLGPNGMDGVRIIQHVCTDLYYFWLQKFELGSS